MNLDGNGHRYSLTFKKPPERVVSLVPSLTESLFDLGFGSSVVGVTDYCVHPSSGLVNVPRVGGTKNPSFEAIVALKPDLVLVNQEENPESLVHELETAGFKVWTTFPKTVRQSVDILWVLVGIFQSRQAAARLETLEVTLDWVVSSLDETRTWSYFCPVWYQSEEKEGKSSWWMTFNRETYASDLLRLVGGRNCFAERVRRYPLNADLGLLDGEEPGGRDTRYPRLPEAEILAAQPEVILLPDEPFSFGQNELDLVNTIFCHTPAVQSGRMYLLDGSLITWHGTRLARALQLLPSIIH